MELLSPLIKVLLFHTFSLHLSSANVHTLQYLHTAVTAGIHFPEYTLVGVVDGEMFVYYDSNIRKNIPKTEWIKKIDADAPNYWSVHTHMAQGYQDDFKVNMAAIMERFNHTKGVHVMQLMIGCDLDDDNTMRGYMQFAYDGADFISLDMKTLTWTAANAKGAFTKLSWEATGFRANYWKGYVENNCLKWVRKYVSYGRTTLERKVPPEASVFQKFSSSPELVCHATGFFPSGVMMSWQKDGEELIEDVDLRETLPNQDGSFQKRSILKVSPEDLQKHEYTCVIKHSSLKEDLVLKVPNGGSGGVPIGIIIGAVVGVLVALIACAAGILLWRKKSFGKEGRRHFFGFTLVPLKSSTPSEEDTTSSSSCEPPH